MYSEQSIFQQFLTGYMVAALWSSSDTMPGDEDGQPAPLDTFEWGDGELLKRAQECAEFFRLARPLLDQFAKAYTPVPGYTVWECAGHDFWLTRCGHGVGFWDRGLDDLGDQLTAVCKEMGEVDLYLGDDEKVYS